MHLFWRTYSEAPILEAPFLEDHLHFAYRHLYHGSFALPATHGSPSTSELLTVMLTQWSTGNRTKCACDIVWAEFTRAERSDALFFLADETPVPRGFMSYDSRGSWPSKTELCSALQFPIHTHTWLALRLSMPDRRLDNYYMFVDAAAEVLDDSLCHWGRSTCDRTVTPHPGMTSRHLSSRADAAIASQARSRIEGQCSRRGVEGRLREACSRSCPWLRWSRCWPAGSSSAGAQEADRDASPRRQASDLSRDGPGKPLYAQRPPFARLTGLGTIEHEPQLRAEGGVLGGRFLRRAA